MLRFVENTTLGEAAELEDGVTIYRDMNLGKGQRRDPTAVKEPWKEPRTLILGPLLQLAATGEQLCGQSPWGEQAQPVLMQQGGLLRPAVPAEVWPRGKGRDRCAFLVLVRQCLKHRHQVSTPHPPTRKMLIAQRGHKRGPQWWPEAGNTWPKRRV